MDYFDLVFATLLMVNQNIYDDCGVNVYCQKNLIMIFLHQIRFLMREGELFIHFFPSKLRMNQIWDDTLQF
jgi:hypothetical protein